MARNFRSLGGVAVAVVCSVGGRRRRHLKLTKPVFAQAGAQWVRQLVRTEWLTEL